MELHRLLEAMQEVAAPDYIAERTDGKVVIELPENVYEEAVAVVNNLKAADLFNYVKAQGAFPKLVNAVKLVLAIADHPFQNPAERVKLASKTRRQLEAALRRAGEEPGS